MNRICIFFFYDQDGIVDDYVYIYLREIKKFVSRLCVVINGKLSHEGNIGLSSIADDLLIRDNTGYDSAAYKFALEFYGYNEISKYKEAILCNFTCYGPIFPFSEMFSEMEKKECDFWGIQRYPRRDNCLIDSIQKTPYVPEHIMSYFICIRQRMLKSTSFKYYWDTLQIAKNYNQAVCVNELRFTDYFESRGFKSAVLMPPSTVQYFSENTSTFAPLTLLQERCPLLKRRVFSSNYGLYLLLGDSSEPRKVLNFIKNNTTYDVNLIIKNLIRTTPGSLLKRTLHLNYFLSNNISEIDINLISKQKVALILYSYYDDRLEYAYSYLKNLPNWVDIYIYVTTEESLKLSKEIFSRLKNRVTINIKQNKGQLASAVLVSARQVFDDYDIVCVTQTKKTSQLADSYSSDQFSNHCWNNVLFSEGYVLNLLNCFIKDKYLGYLCAIPPHWKEFKNLIGNELCANKEGMLHLMKKLSIPDSMFDNEPIASYGECFWVRSAALKTILNYKWSHNDFPPQNEMKKDGTILNAIERIYPICARNDGYYSGWIAPLEIASAYFDNIYFQLREKNIQQIISNSNKQSSSVFQILFFYLLKKIYHFVYYLAPNPLREILLKIRSAFIKKLSEH